MSDSTPGGASAGNDPATTPGSAIRILIVDDALVARRSLREIFAAEADFEVIGEATDGDEGVEAAARLRPDVVTMDVEMPRMDGLTALAEIMRTNPTPTTMVSSHTRTGARATIKSIEAGAVGFVAKPGGPITPEQFAEDIVRAVRVAAHTPVISAREAPAEAHGFEWSYGLPPGGHGATGQAVPTVVISASTGAITALFSTLAALPSSFPAAVLVLLPTFEAYTLSLGMALAGRCRMPVKRADEGETIEPGIIYIAPGEHHITVTGDGVFELEAAGAGTRAPSANVAISSIAWYAGDYALGVLLSSDIEEDAVGAEFIKQDGGQVIGEAAVARISATAAARAREADAIDAILPVGELPGRIVAWLETICKGS